MRSVEMQLRRSVALLLTARGFRLRGLDKPACLRNNGRRHSHGLPIISRHIRHRLFRALASYFLLFPAVGSTRTGRRCVGCFDGNLRWIIEAERGNLSLRVLG